MKTTLHRTHSAPPCGSQSIHKEPLYEETENCIAGVYEYSSKEDTGNSYGSQVGSPKRWAKKETVRGKPEVRRERRENMHEKWHRRILQMGMVSTAIWRYGA